MPIEFLAPWLVVSAISHFGLMATYVLTAALLLRSVASLGWQGVAVALITYLTIAALVLVGLHRYDHQLGFGAASALTLMRAATAALFLGVVVDAWLAEFPLAFNTKLRWILTVLATAALLVDGLDGWVARRKGMASEFGARFDMETDALSVAALSLLVHAEGEVGAWVLLGGSCAICLWSQALCGRCSAHRFCRRRAERPFAPCRWRPLSQRLLRQCQRRLLRRFAFAVWFS